MAKLVIFTTQIRWQVIETRSPRNKWIPDPHLDLLLRKVEKSSALENTRKPDSGK